MNLNNAIFNYTIQPKYIVVYNLIEELKKVNNTSIRKAHLEDIINILTNIIAIKKNYNIDCKEDYVLLSKYKEQLK